MAVTNGGVRAMLALVEWSLLLAFAQERPPPEAPPRKGPPRKKKNQRHSPQCAIDGIGGILDALPKPTREGGKE